MGSNCPLLMAAGLMIFSGCVTKGPAGETGPQGAPCTVVDNADGSATMSCPDGTSVRLPTVTDGGVPPTPDAGGAVDAAVEAAGDAGSMQPCETFAEDTVIHGAYVIHNSLESALLQGYRCIDGDLIVDGTVGLSGLRGAESLERITGELRLANNAALRDTDALGNLTSLGSAVVLANQNLVSFALVRLSEVGRLGAAEAMRVENNPAMTSLGMPALGVAHAGVVLARLPVLQAVVFPSLSFVNGSIEMHDLPQLEFQLPALSTVVGGLSVADTALTSFLLPALSTVAADLSLERNDGIPDVTLTHLTWVGGDLRAARNQQLGGISVPALTVIGAELDVSLNPRLATLDLSGLVRVGGFFTVSGNPMLPECEPTAVADRLRAATPPGLTFSPYIGGNDTRATCEP